MRNTNTYIMKKMVNMIKIQKTIMHEKGAALPMVLLAFLVLSIFSVSVLSLAEFDTKMSYKESKMNQAYYIAQNAVQALADYLIEYGETHTAEETDDLIQNLITVGIEPVAMGGGTINLSLALASDNLVISGTSTYQGETKSIKTNLDYTVTTGTAAFNPTSLGYSLVGLGGEPLGLKTLSLTSGAMLSGDVFINSTTPDSVYFRGGSAPNVSGKLTMLQGANASELIDTDRGDRNSNAPLEYQKSHLSQTAWINNWAFWLNIGSYEKTGVPLSYPSEVFPEPTFPNFSDVNFGSKQAALTTPSSNRTITLGANAYFDAINPSSSRTITFDLGGHTRHVMVDALTLTGGNLEVTNHGGGKLILYVNNSFNLGSSRKLNGNGTVDNVIVYYRGTSTLTVSGDSTFKGTMFVESANASIGASVTTEGSFISLGDQITVTGNARMNAQIYAPTSLVALTGSSQISGSVICAALSRSGGGNPGIIYTALDYEIPTEIIGSQGESLVLKYRTSPWEE